MCEIGGITGGMAKSFISDDQMRTVWQQRQDRRRIGSLGETVSRLMKKTLSKRVRQLGQIAEVWDDLIPPNLRDHTALDTFVRGTLTVMVDSASHRYQLQNQIRSGLKNSIQARCSATIPGYDPIIMDIDQALETANASPKAIIVAIHMEALDHCPISRADLRKRADRELKRPSRLMIPEDGEVISF